MLNNDAPQWMLDYAGRCRVLYGLHSWDLALRLVDKPGESDSADGYTETNTRYLSASVEIRHDADAARVRESIQHELMHVAFAPVILAFERISDLLPERLRQHARDLFDDANEASIESLVRALREEGVFARLEPSVSNEEATGGDE